MSRLERVLREFGEWRSWDESPWICGEKLFDGRVEVGEMWEFMFM